MVVALWLPLLLPWQPVAVPHCNHNFPMFYCSQTVNRTLHHWSAYHMENTKYYISRIDLQLL